MRAHAGHELRQLFHLRFGFGLALIPLAGERLGLLPGLGEDLLGLLTGFSHDSIRSLLSGDECAPDGGLVLAWFSPAPYDRCLSRHR